MFAILSISIERHNTCTGRIILLFALVIFSLAPAITGQYLNFPAYTSNQFYPGSNVCAQDDPTITRSGITSAAGCSLLCSQVVVGPYSLDCLAFNYRSVQQICELFLYVPNSYVPVTGCTHYQQPQLTVIPSGSVNRAYNQPTYQSSDYHGVYVYYSSYAVDGNADPYLYNKSCSHTNAVAGINSWWAVDLGSSYQVNMVKVTNRDTLPERLADFAVTLTNISPASYVGSSFIPNDRSICAFYPGYPAASSTVTVVCRKDVRPGRFLYIESSIPQLLALCEVQVF